MIKKHFFKNTMELELTAFLGGFWGSVNEFYTTVGALLPKAIQAFFTIVFGWLLGLSIEIAFRKIGKTHRARRIWELTGFDDFVKKSGVKSDPAALTGVALKSTILLWFLRSAAKKMGFFQVESFLNSVLALIPDLAIGLLILLFAVRWANTAAKIVEKLAHIADKNTKAILAAVARNILIAFGILAALFQIRVAPELVQTLFTAFVAMLALAGGLAFGLGGKDFVHEILEEFRHGKPGKKTTKK